MSGAIHKRPPLAQAFSPNAAGPRRHTKRAPPPANTGASVRFIVKGYSTVSLMQHVELESDVHVGAYNNLVAHAQIAPS